MTKLNLLPKTTKERLSKEAQTAEVANNALILTLAIIIVSGILFGGKFYLNAQIKKINQLDTDSRENNKITEINSQLLKISTIQKDYTKWSQILKQILEVTPENVELKNIDIDKNKSSIKIDGIAQKRSDFLVYKDRLSELSFIEKIESPLSNILKQTDIGFNLSANLILEKQ